MDYIHFKINKSPYNDLDANALRVSTVYDKTKGGYTVVAELIYIDEFKSEYDFKTAHGLKEYKKHEGRIQELIASAKYRNEEDEAKANEYTKENAVTLAEKLLIKINSSLGTELTYEKCSNCNECKKTNDTRSCCSFDKDKPISYQTIDVFGQL